MILNWVAGTRLSVNVSCPTET